ncbi:Tho Complex Subunit 3 [Manis pentadactyla]|nr:Tho Complex Subunit 3 [Manis pentadactyla]
MYVKHLGENINICWSPDVQTIAVGNKDDVVTSIDAKTHLSKAEEQFKFEVNGISWNNDNNMFFLTNGNGCINILSFDWTPEDRDEALSKIWREIDRIL